ncbi:hypothetical protein TcarDRAFT_2247 [Thermosinus carboxydivorans Nor1]|uniref:Type I-B CRISPR-associated protein Cas8b1/Cst1 n=1 Tax=Thermosinus carboxydivorans Nor1 TaxID=401526 RepID=A1HND5_9FIRM|nr:hypothetical protein [Thermosinus carboxydivorans]EAX48297.1 hypothetical protein TcarDRAFT_2247 [Thermosinus carboxydivorans Nor1]
MLRYTGHPFVDVGIAVMESLLRPKECHAFTRKDLKFAADWLIRIYERKDLRGYLTVHFPNSGWCNPTIKEAKKEEYIKKVLFSYDAPPLEPERSCAFCSNKAQLLADRQHIPLLTGATVLVTAPGGVAGLPVCGYCLMAVQFYPLGTKKVDGRPLFWWTVEPELTFALVSNTFGEFRQSLAVTEDKVINFKWPYTRLMEDARRVLEEYDLMGEDKPLADCIGYHVTNYGSEPDFEQYHIPKELLEFWRDLKFAPEAVRLVHSQIEKKSWEAEKEKGGGKKQKAKQGNQSGEHIVSRRNFYYEALGRAFKERDWKKEVRNIVTRFYLNTEQENLHLNNFQLCEMFLQRVGGMEKQRLDIIRDISDRIIEVLVLGNNDVRWLNDLYNREMLPQEFLRYLVRVQKELSRFGKPISYDSILLMFDMASEDDANIKDAYLIRSLMLIRMFERVVKEKQDLLEKMSDSESDGR